ncbi:ATP-binding protein [Roseospira navarrensis]|uniref:ATP-binding protein n=1 Tax=Roseospira navarrensis TaxID=140058 RepID=UPI001478B71E
MLQAWRAERDAGRRTLESVQMALSQHLAATLGTMDDTLAILGHQRLWTTGVPGPVSRDLEPIASPLPFVRALILLNPDGVVVADSRPGHSAIGLDVSDREYFKQLLIDPTRDTVVSRPIRSRVDGDWAFPVSHALRAADGTLTGVLVASISIAYLNDLFADLGQNFPGMAILLTGTDGTVQARWPADAVPMGAPLGDAALIRAHVRTAPSGTYWGTSPVDGTVRLVRYSVLESLPLVLAVGLDRNVLFASTIQQAWLWGSASLVVAVIVLLGTRHMGRMATALETAMVAAEAADRRKDEFVANMSHEIRTPLNAVIGFSEIMHEDALGAGMPAVYADYARDIHQSGRYLLGIVDEILDLSALSAHRLILCEDIVDPEALLYDLVQMMEVRARSRAIDLSVDALPVPVPRLVADRRRLAQVLLNLVTNAIKFTQRGGWVRVGLREGPDGLDLYVQDNGPGIPQDRLAVIMKPFERDRPSGISSDEGVGLGLAVASGLVEAHGGALTLRSTLGQGTEAVAHLPRTRLRLPGSASG